jgi:lysophospholipase L1-like esterase
MTIRRAWCAMMLAAGLSAAATAAFAQSPPPPPVMQPAVCEVPSYLTASDSQLTRVAAALKRGGPLDILVLGTGSSTLGGAEGTSAAWPQRLEQALRRKLPGFTVNVTAAITARQGAEDAAEALPKLLTERKPALVIWQTGTVDAMRNVHADDFRIALETGLEALQKADADALLMNLQYSPRTETMISVTPYNDTMRLVAQQQNVPLFDRFAVMHHWNETGEFDLFGTTRDATLAKRVHDCIGRALALLVVDATKLGPNDLKVPR